jgi:hypothetical protein
MNSPTDFMWKTKDGRLLHVTQMGTHHLYSIVKMLWNHTAPDHLQLKPFKQYRLGPRFTHEYTSKAVRHIVKELATRTDLTPYMIKTLEFMALNGEKRRRRLTQT